MLGKVVVVNGVGVSVGVGVGSVVGDGEGVGAGVVVSLRGLYCSTWSFCSVTTKAPVKPPKAYMISSTAATPRL